jgi:hypothetical protein
MLKDNLKGLNLNVKGLEKLRKCKKTEKKGLNLNRGRVENNTKKNINFA